MQCFSEIPKLLGKIEGRRRRGRQRMRWLDGISDPGHEFELTQGVGDDREAWCAGMTQRDGMGREVRGGFRTGNSCTPMADSC